tara:strand:- start:400 stop:648 length:249 start_codon:yes stop_codon:yes gene_type:complete
MKELGLSWGEIKSTARFELEGLLLALGEYNVLHSMDGYDSEDINDMAKNKPAIRGQWARYNAARGKYYSQNEGKKKTFKGMM